MTKLEQMARAMAENAGFCWKACAREQWIGDARAALQVLLEPDEGMLEASNREWDGRMSYRSSGAFQAVIHHILNEKPEQEIK